MIVVISIVHAIAFLVMALAGSFTVHAQCDLPLREWYGKYEHSFAEVVSDAGDVNADGVPDVLIGAPHEDRNGVQLGSAYVYSGATGDLLYLWDGEAEYDSFGAAVSGAGDINGDGFADVIIGAPFADDGTLDGVGSAYVYSGATGDMLYHWRGPVELAIFGYAVNDAGDVNGDGFADVIVGAPGASNSLSGNSYIYSGATGALLHTGYGAHAGNSFGHSVAGAGDVNGDGVDDFIVGDPDDDSNGEDSGSAYVFTGAGGWIIDVRSGGSAGDSLGVAVSGAGDVDRDGFDDVIIGASNASIRGPRSGSAYVLSVHDGVVLYMGHGRHRYEEFGHSVDGAGDMNGDGYDDVVIGAPYGYLGTIHVGHVYVVSGATGGLLARWKGQREYELFGASVSGAGDVSGDGVVDVLVGAPGVDPHGAAYVLSLVCQPPSLSGPTPGLAGEINRFEIGGATPDSMVMFTWGFQSAETPVAECPGLFLLIDNPRAIPTQTDKEGRARVTVYVPPAARGTRVLFQALDPHECTVSDLLEHRFK